MKTTTDHVGLATKVEAAEFLSLSVQMIDKLIRKADIPVERFGRSVRISWAWLESRAGVVGSR
jgi:excisionase family DNA binding protein